MKNLLLWSNPSPQPDCPESPFHAHDFKYEKKETVGKKLIQNSKFWIHRDEITAHYIICFKAEMPLFYFITTAYIYGKRFWKNSLTLRLNYSVLLKDTLVQQTLALTQI